MFYYFPGNYVWSSAFTLALMAGGQLNQVDRWLAPLRDAGPEPDTDAWTKAWDCMGEEQSRHAAQERADGYAYAASARYFRAATYHLTGERQTPPGPAKTHSYTAALEVFASGVELMARPIERVEVESPDGILPGYLIPSGTDGPAPVVIFYSGLDVTKEILYGIIGGQFGRRGIACLIIDTPGTGEPLRLRGVPSRPDYEVPTAAIVDYLQARPDVDPGRIGLLGISLGGYYAPRGAAFEHRITACAAWGAVWDYGRRWQHRWETRSTTTLTPFWQLPWVMGTDTMEAALERVRQWTLADVMPHLTQPLLIVHGEHDSAFPVSDAEAAFAAGGSKDKTLRIFTIEEGGSEPCPCRLPDRPLAASQRSTSDPESRKGSPPWPS
ncbi:MAG TPA: alpha/beta fold hydrolase [Streptosporangiaceae bacterium]